MTTRVDVFKERRLVPVQFERAKDGAPEASKPDIDTRGTRSPELAHIVSVMQGDRITVRLRRHQIDAAARLFVTSKNTGFVRVTSPATGELPSGATADIELEGVSGGNPNETRLEVRYGSATGVILHELVVRCFSEITVVVTPHLVTINQADGAAPGVTSNASVADILRSSRDIWRPYGIVLDVQPTEADTVTLATAGIVNDNPYPGELATILGTNWKRNTINVYFVPQIGTTALGYGFSRAVFAAHGVPNPGILLGDRHPSWTPDAEWKANDISHEIGHFFTLEHVNRPPTTADIRRDFWGRRMLMHNNNVQGQMGDWRDDVGYGQFGGFCRRGALVTHKDLSTISTDGEAAQARGAAAAPY